MEEVLGGKVVKVLVNSRMADSPCVFTTSDYGWSANMARIMEALAPSDLSTASYMVSKKDMEINPKHSIMTVEIPLTTPLLAQENELILVDSFRHVLCKRRKSAFSVLV